MTDHCSIIHILLSKHLERVAGDVTLNIVLGKSEPENCVLSLQNMENIISRPNSFYRI